MTTAPAARPHATHEVLNQVPPLAGYDVADDPALLEAAAREDADWAAGRLHELGRLAGAAETNRRGNTSSAGERNPEQAMRKSRHPALW